MQPQRKQSQTQHPVPDAPGLGEGTSARSMPRAYHNLTVRVGDKLASQKLGAEPVANTRRVLLLETAAFLWRHACPAQVFPSGTSRKQHLFLRRIVRASAREPSLHRATRGAPRGLRRWLHRVCKLACHAGLMPRRRTGNRRTSAADVARYGTTAVALAFSTLFCLQAFATDSTTVGFFSFVLFGLYGATNARVLQVALSDPRVDIDRINYDFREWLPVLSLCVVSSVFLERLPFRSAPAHGGYPTRGLLVASLLGPTTNDLLQLCAIQLPYAASFPEASPITVLAIITSLLALSYRFVEKAPPLIRGPDGEVVRKLFGSQRGDGHRESSSSSSPFGSHDGGLPNELEMGGRRKQHGRSSRRVAADLPLALRMPPSHGGVAKEGAAAFGGGCCGAACGRAKGRDEQAVILRCPPAHGISRTASPRRGAAAHAAGRRSGDVAGTGSASSRGAAGAGSASARRQNAPLSRTGSSLAPSAGAASGRRMATAARQDEEADEEGEQPAKPRARAQADARRAAPGSPSSSRAASPAAQQQGRSPSPAASSAALPGYMRPKAKPRTEPAEPAQSAGGGLHDWSRSSSPSASFGQRSVTLPRKAPGGGAQHGARSTPPASPDRRQAQAQQRPPRTPPSPSAPRSPQRSQRAANSDGASQRSPRPASQQAAGGYNNQAAGGYNSNNGASSSFSARAQTVSPWERSAQSNKPSARAAAHPPHPRAEPAQPAHPSAGGTQPSYAQPVNRAMAQPTHAHAQCSGPSSEASLRGRAASGASEAGLRSKGTSNVSASSGSSLGGSAAQPKAPSTIQPWTRSQVQTVSRSRSHSRSPPPESLTTASAQDSAPAVEPPLSPQAAAAPAAPHKAAPPPLAPPPSPPPSGRQSSTGEHARSVNSKSPQPQPPSSPSRPSQYTGGLLFAARPPPSDGKPVWHPAAMTKPTLAHRELPAVQPFLAATGTARAWSPAPASSAKAAAAPEAASTAGAPARGVTAPANGVPSPIKRQGSMSARLARPAVQRDARRSEPAVPAGFTLASIALRASPEEAWAATQARAARAKLAEERKRREHDEAKREAAARRAARVAEARLHGGSLPDSVASRSPADSARAGCAKGTSAPSSGLASPSRARRQVEGRTASASSSRAMSPSRSRNASDASAHRQAVDAAVAGWGGRESSRGLLPSPKTATRADSSALPSERAAVLAGLGEQ